MRTAKHSRRAKACASADRPAALSGRCRAAGRSVWCGMKTRHAAANSAALAGLTPPSGAASRGRSWWWCETRRAPSIATRQGRRRMCLFLAILRDQPVRQREQHGQHGIQMPRERHEVLAARPPLAREPVFHGPLTGPRPAHGGLDRPVSRSKLRVQCHSNRGAIVAWPPDQMHNCALLRHNCAYLDPHFRVLLR